MLLLNPREVTFKGERWADVSLVAVDRRATREVVELGDTGPHAVFADVRAQRVTVRVERDILRDAIESPSPGEAGELSFRTAPASGQAGRRRLTMQAVVLSVSHELSLRRGAVRRVEFVAISGDGAQDPITAQEDEG